MLSPEWNARIQQWLVEYLASPGLQHELRDVAAFGALPLYSDVGGALGLRPDGRVIQVVWDAPERSFFDADEKWRTVALVSGCERWPELRELLPERTDASRDCTNCDGTGRFMGTATICGACFGLGFLRQ